MGESQTVGKSLPLLQLWLRCERVHIVCRFDVANTTIFMFPRARRTSQTFVPETVLFFEVISSRLVKSTLVILPIIPRPPRAHGFNIITNPNLNSGLRWHCGGCVHKTRSVTLCVQRSTLSAHDQTQVRRSSVARRAMRRDNVCSSLSQFICWSRLYTTYNMYTHVLYTTCMYDPPTNRYAIGSAIYLGYILGRLCMANFGVWYGGDGCTVRTVRRCRTPVCAYVIHILYIHLRTFITNVILCKITQSRATHLEGGFGGRLINRSVGFVCDRLCCAIHSIYFCGSRNTICPYNNWPDPLVSIPWRRHTTHGWHFYRMELKCVCVCVYVLFI